jgi:hypothetical protein
MISVPAGLRAVLKVNSKAYGEGKGKAGYRRDIRCMAGYHHAPNIFSSFQITMSEEVETKNGRLTTG